MTGAGTVTRIVSWPLDAVIGIWRSLVLVAVCWILPAACVVIAIYAFRAATSELLAIWWIVWSAWIALIVCTRWICQLVRLLVRRWLRVSIHPAYRETVPLTRLATGYWWNGYDYTRYKLTARWNRWFRARVRDPGSWRDLIWIFVSPISVGIVGALPLLGIGLGGYELGYGDSPVWGVLAIIAGLATAPYAWRIVGPLATRLLGPSSLTRLNDRVRRLVAARADATRAQSVELTRIERDLHDGAQARIVALGMAIGAAEKLIDSDPEGAKQSLREARAASSTALAELRDLVRGINPPVLTERGLVDAVRALALDAPIPVSVTSRLEGRLETPIESALYFGASELMTNAAKHAVAARAAVVIEYRSGSARVSVADDGRGGATVAGGSGLAGLVRRMANFDGTVEIDSPIGGPTTVTMVVPCELL